MAPWSIALLTLTGCAAAAPMISPPRAALVIQRAAHAWQSQQVQEPCLLPNPKQPGKLLLLYSGVPAAHREIALVGKAWADVADPLTWHEDAANPIFGPGEGDRWDRGSIRLDCVLYIPEADAYYVYYSGTTGAIQDRIGLAIFPVGPDGYSGLAAAQIRRFDAPVLAPEAAAPFREEMVSQAAVHREWNAPAGRWDWFMYYSYRGPDGILPGLRLATSTDGRHWTRQLNATDPRGLGHLFASLPGAYYEWHQIFKVGSTYVLSMEVGPNHGERWRPVLAVSAHPDRGWRQLDVDTVLQTKWTGVYRDEALYHVATPAFYEIAGRWYLFMQACAQPPSAHYIDGRWDMRVVACDYPLRLPGTADTLGLPAAP